MAMPRDWLCCRTTRAEVEETLAEVGAPEIWLRKWRQIVERMRLDDELWEYYAHEDAPAIEVPAPRIEGFEQVLDNELLDQLGLAEQSDWIGRYRSGFALVQGNEIIDWIESPP